MEKYKLKKDFLYLQAWDIVEIRVEKYLDNNIVKYVIFTEKNWLIWEITNTQNFNFHNYFEKIKIPKSIFELKDWDKYYFLDSGLYVYSYYYDWDETDKDMLEIWNVFLTREEAEKEIERTKAIQKIKKYCWENKIKYKENVSDETFYIGIIYDSEDEEFYPSTCTDRIEYWVLFFDSYEDLENILKNCEKELEIIFDI